MKRLLLFLLLYLSFSGARAQVSNTQYTVNAQGRIVTWYRSLPHYVMAHLVYHFNKNPKKK